LQLNTTDPLPLKSLCSSRIHYSVLGSKSCFLAYIGNQSSTLPHTYMMIPCTLKCQANLGSLASRETEGVS
jgi:hypothetical protein